MLSVNRKGRSTCLRKDRRSKTGRGFVNALINKLPVELHLPGYQFCGPGTKLQHRLQRGDKGKNPLDAACKIHDIAYASSNDLGERHKADKQLEYKAWERVKSKDAGVGEKAAALLVTNIMKGKRRFGLGCSAVQSTKSRKIKRPLKKKKKPSKKKISFGSGYLGNVRKAIKKVGGQQLVNKGINKAAQLALMAARKSLKTIGGKRKVQIPRIIPVPKVGGILPLIPIFAGLSALGGLAGGAAGLARVVNAAKTAQSQLTEATRHNRQMEAIALGKGIFLKPYRTGLGLYLTNSKN